jgi:hypothetical protein
VLQNEINYLRCEIERSEEVRLTNQGRVREQDMGDLKIV